MKLALFSSVADNSETIKHYLSHMKNYCDLFINYYGQEFKIYNDIKSNCKYIQNKYTTKFPALKQCYNNSSLNKYDYVFVFDDDMVLQEGNLLDIIKIMVNYNLELASASHSLLGKISHPIMIKNKGNHIFRYTNFVEMNFPVFSKNALHKYMSVYDGKLCGWGNDWWYLNALNSNTQKNAAIIDRVCIENPHSDKKKDPTIHSFMKSSDRQKQWLTIKNKLDLIEWYEDNLEFIYA